MTIEETLRAAEVKTADNGLVFGLIEPTGDTGAERPPIERLVNIVPRGLVARLGRSMVYFVPWLYKQRRGVAVGTAPENGESRKDICHHLDIKPGGNLLLISTHFYESDRYGLAMEFYDKVSCMATLEPESRHDFEELLRKQWDTAKPGELTPETWEFRKAAADAECRGPDWEFYMRAAEADALALYMASLFTDIFYEDLFDDDDDDFPACPPDVIYDRVRLAERLYPANRGYSLQVVRQKPRRRGGR